MSVLSNPATRQLWARLARISIALAIMRAARSLDALAEWLLPGDFRRGREDRDKGVEN